MATDPRITDRGGSDRPSWPAIWLFAFAVATPLAWSSVAFVYFGMLAAGKPLTFGHSLLAGLPDWYVWAAFTPVVFSLGQRFRLERHRWVAGGLFHLVFGTVVALGDLALVTAINRHFGPTVSYGQGRHRMPRSRGEGVRGFSYRHTSSRYSPLNVSKRLIIVPTRPHPCFS